MADKFCINCAHFVLNSVEWSSQENRIYYGHCAKTLKRDPITGGFMHGKEGNARSTRNKWWQCGPRARWYKEAS